jgi:hypothetical protein
MQTQLRALSFACLLVSFTATACTLSSGDPESAKFSLVSKCTKNSCEKARADKSEACSRCSSACFAASYKCDTERSCHYSCESVSCDDKSATCVETSLAPAYGAADATVQGACDAYVTHESRCDASARPLRCEVAAKVFTPAAVAMFQCQSSLACGAEDTCPELPDSNFDVELCAGLETAGFSCDVQAHRSFKWYGALLREDVKAVALACANAPAGRQRVACYSTWLDATALAAN